MLSGREREPRSQPCGGWRMRLSPRPSVRGFWASSTTGRRYLAWWATECVVERMLSVARRCCVSCSRDWKMSKGVHTTLPLFTCAALLSRRSWDSSSRKRQRCLRTTTQSASGSLSGYGDRAACLPPTLPVYAGLLGDDWVICGQPTSGQCRGGLLLILLCVEHYLTLPNQRCDCRSWA